MLTGFCLAYLHGPPSMQSKRAAHMSGRAETAHAGLLHPRQISWHRRGTARDAVCGSRRSGWDRRAARKLIQRAEAVPLQRRRIMRFKKKSLLRGVETRRTRPERIKRKNVKCIREVKMMKGTANVSGYLLRLCDGIKFVKISFSQFQRRRKWEKSRIMAASRNVGIQTSTRQKKSERKM